MTSITKSWNPKYKQEWQRVAKSLINYDPDTKFSSFTERYMNGYLAFLSQTMRNEKIKKNLFKIKEFLTWARNKKYHVNDEFFTYKPKLQSVHKEVRYLLPFEVTTIINLNIPPNTQLSITRDLFIFSCFTALRYSDLKALKKSNIYQNHDNEYVIDIVTQKDKGRVTFVLPQEAVNIYLKYKDFEYENNVMFPVISNQKYNESLKELGKRADIRGEYTDTQYRLGVKEEIKHKRCDLDSHDGRHTFIVTALNNGHDPLKVAKITSHASLDSMKPYIEVTDASKRQVISSFDKLFSNME